MWLGWPHVRGATGKERLVLKFIGWALLIIVLIGLLVVFGIIDLIF